MLIREENKKTRALGKCECGTEKYFVLGNLKTGQTTSCGCSRKKPKSKPRKAGEDVCARHIYGSYRLGAVKRNLQFGLTFDEFKHLIKMNCCYCGSTPKQKCILRYAKGDKKGQSRTDGYLTYTGIDRKDNSLGYDANNCVACCYKCNFAKSNSDRLTYLRWLLCIAQNIHNIESIAVKSK